MADIDQTAFENKFSPDLSQTEFESKYNPSTQDPGNYSGSMADDFFSHNKVGRILNAFGQGYQQDWGAQGVNLEGDLKDWVSKTDVLNNFVQQHKDLAKGFNEGFIRPWAHVIDSAANSAMGILGGITRATGETGNVLQEMSKDTSEHPNDFLDRYAVAPVLGAAGEILQNIEPRPFDESDPTNKAISGFVVPELPFLELPERVFSSRASGAIGEGEAGYFNTRPVSETNLQERQGAAQEVGIQPPPVQPPVRDPNYIARLVDPDTFNEWDRLQERQEHFRQAIDYWTNKTGPESEEVANTRLKLLENDYALRDLIPKTAEARQYVEDYMNSESKEGAAFRNWVQAKYFEHEMEMADLADRVDETTNYAQSLMEDPFNSAKKEKTPTGVSEEEKISTAERSYPYGAGGDYVNTRYFPKEEQVANPELQSKPVETVPGGAKEAPVEAGEIGRPEGQLEGSGPRKTAGLARSIEDSAIEGGLQERFGDLPSFEGVTVKDQLERADKLIDEDYNRAKRVAFGREAPPEGLRSVAVLMRVENRARAEGDWETLRRLANSSITTEVSHGAQTLSLLAERDSESPVSLMRSIDETRKARKVKQTEREVKSLESKLEEATKYNEQVISDFLKSIECDY